MSFVQIQTFRRWYIMDLYSGPTRLSNNITRMELVSVAVIVRRIIVFGSSIKVICFSTYFPQLNTNGATIKNSEYKSNLGNAFGVEKNDEIIHTAPTP